MAVRGRGVQEDGWTGGDGIAGSVIGIYSLLAFWIDSLMGWWLVDHSFHFVSFRSFPFLRLFMHAQASLVYMDCVV